VPLLKARNDHAQNRAIFWHFPHTYDQPPYSSVRQGKWKLIYHHVTRKLELFNLDQDISETTNLASAQPAKLEALVDILTAHLRSTHAPMPLDKSTGQPVEYPGDLP